MISKIVGVILVFMSNVVLFTRRLREANYVIFAASTSSYVNFEYVETYLS